MFRRNRSSGFSSLTTSFIFAIILFLTSLALGMGLASDVSASMVEELRPLLKPAAELSSPGLLLLIFLNNAVKTLVVILLGVFLGLPPFVFVTFNGFLLGLLIQGLAPATGYAMVTAGLAPHGVIEIPMLLLATGLGLLIGKESLKWLIRRDSRVKLELSRALRIYYQWILVGLFVAALIEVFVTPHLVHLTEG